MAFSFQDMLQPTAMAPPAHIQLLVARTLDGPRRLGVFTSAEIAYAYHMSDAFKLGLFDAGIREGASVRIWLSTLLNCSRMRLSKKFDRKVTLLGKCRFKKDAAALAAMSHEERLDRHNDMEAARRRFMESIGESSLQVFSQGLVVSARPNLPHRMPRAPDNFLAAKVAESPRSVSCPDLGGVSHETLMVTMQDDGLVLSVDLEPFIVILACDYTVPAKTVESSRSVSTQAYQDLLEWMVTINLDDGVPLPTSADLEPIDWHEVSELLADDTATALK